jgi:hypothetical protein
MASLIAVAKLSQAEQRQLGKNHPEIRQGESALVISAPRSMLSAFVQLAEQIAWEREQADRVLAEPANDGAARSDRRP